MGKPKRNGGLQSLSTGLFRRQQNPLQDRLFRFPVAPPGPAESSRFADDRQLYGCGSIGMYVLELFQEFLFLFEHLKGESLVKSKGLKR